MGYSIRGLDAGDAPGVCAFLRGVSDDFPVPLSSKVEIPDYVDKLLGRGLAFGAVSDAGELVGVAAGYANDRERMAAFLSVIAVAGEARGGVASRALLAAFEDGARSRGMCTVSLETHGTNARAIRFYRKAGYLVDEGRVSPHGDVAGSKPLCGLADERPNVLLTSVGRRAYLVEWFKEALGGRGGVHVVNSHSQTPAFAAADRATVCPPIYSAEYVPFLLDYVRENRVGAVLSLFDVDVPVLAAHRADFARLGCFPVVASPLTASVCNDKLAAAGFLGSAGIPTVATYAGADEFLAAVSEGSAAFPAVVKPRWGMGSIGVLEVENEEELRAACSMVARRVEGSYLRYESGAEPGRAVVVQPAVRGRECGMDVMNGLDGSYRACSARRKEAMRAGETDVARTVVGDGRFDSLARSISGALAFPGNMDVDVFDTEGGLVVLEMNARFGGGYPFSHMAGVDLPAALVAWLRGGREPEGSLECGRPGTFMKEIELVRLGECE